jgi:hypothetical protein
MCPGCFLHVLPCPQPAEAQLSDTIAQNGVEGEVSQFCVLGVVHPIVVPPLSITPHTSYPPPHHAAAEAATVGRQEGGCGD